jgi:hypothetical protein
LIQQTKTTTIVDKTELLIKRIIQKALENGECWREGIDSRCNIMLIAQQYACRHFVNDGNDVCAYYNEQDNRCCYFQNKE